jgi:hypothetical protein
MKEERDENLGSRRSPSKSILIDEIIPLSPQFIGNKKLFYTILLANCEKFITFALAF